MVEKANKKVSTDEKQLKKLFKELRAAKARKKAEIVAALKIQIKEYCEALPSKNKTVLQALNSNNIAFEVFSFFEQPKGLITFRILSRKALEKSQYLYQYLGSPLYFQDKLLAFDPIFHFHIGVFVRKAVLKTLEKSISFNKLFVFKEHPEDFVHYLPRKDERSLLERVTCVRTPLRSEKMNPLALTQELEERLLGESFKNPNGSEKVDQENYRKMLALLKPYLVDKETMLTISGSFYERSTICCDEESREMDYIPYDHYRLLDARRFQLSFCEHASMHVQSHLTFVIGADHFNTHCPDSVGKLCGSKYSNGVTTYAKHHFWHPQDYHTFLKAFFRSSQLVDAFLKPEYGGHPHLYVIEKGPRPSTVCEDDY